VDKPAILGGNPIRNMPYPPNITTGKKERAAVLRFMTRGILSSFEGTNNEFFYGGKEVVALEREWKEKFQTKHAISVNSATSGLYAAVGAAGIAPGDEVVVTPFTMSATATAVIAYNGIPVFADVDPDTFNLDPISVEKKITPYTKAILAVHIFGHPAPMNELMEISKKHNLVLIEDAAQSPMALYRGKLTGSIGDIGIFSLNSNKHIQCGEGGMVVTNNDYFAERTMLIRNHAEAVVANGRKVESLVNLVGFNYRMNEIEAAISRCQLAKIDDLLKRRLELVDYLNNRLRCFKGITTPVVKTDCTHVFYRYALSIDRSIIPLSAGQFVDALNAEGMDFYVSYMKPLYLQPIFQQLIAFGERGCPFRCPWYKGRLNYERGICPEAENLEERIISTEIVRPPQTERDMEEIYQAIKKVIDNAGEIDAAKSKEQIITDV